MRQSRHRGLFWLAFALLLACACPPPAAEICDDGVDNDANGETDCDDSQCDDQPACMALLEDCNTPGDQDGDGLDDDADPACFSGISPITSITCTGQDTNAAAGADTEHTQQPGACDVVTRADSGDGQTIEVSIQVLDDAGVVMIEVETAADGSDPAPHATVEADLELDYARGGSWALVAAIAAVDGAAEATATVACTERGHTNSATAPGRIRVPTEPTGGTIDCHVSVATDAKGAGNGHLAAFIGVQVAPDGDRDGVIDVHDLCDHTPPGVEADDVGCAEHGTYGGGFYYCNGFCSFNASEQGFCSNCGVATRGAFFAAFDDAESITSNLGGGVFCDGCEITEESDDWHVDGTGAFCGWPASGEFYCNDCPAGGCGVEIGNTQFRCPLDASCDFVADPAALASNDPHAATVTKQTTDSGDDGIFPFRFETNGNSYDREITTDQGNGEKAQVFVFAGQVTVEELETAGWDLSAISCPDTAGLVTLTDSATCQWTNDRQEPSSLFPIGVTYAETFATLPLHFAEADFPPAERFAVSGANGFATYDAYTLGLVPGLTKLGDFTWQNLLGSIWFDLPGSNLDALLAYRIGSGTLQTAYDPDFHSFGFTGLGNSDVRTTTKEDGDPEAQSGLFASPTFGVYRFLYTDFGTPPDLFLSYGPHVGTSLLPSGYQAVAAWKTSTNALTLIAAASTTPGAPGKLFLAEPTTPFGGATEVGTIGPDPRLLECATATTGWWICGVTDFASDEIAIATWNGAGTAAIVDAITGVDGALGLVMSPQGDKVQLAATHYSENAVTLATLDGATGAVEGSTEVPAPAGCTEPSSVLRRGDGALLALCNNGSTGGASAIWTDAAPAFP